MVSSCKEDLCLTRHQEMMENIVQFLCEKQGFVHVFFKKILHTINSTIVQKIKCSTAQ